MLDRPGSMVMMVVVVVPGWLGLVTEPAKYIYVCSIASLLYGTCHYFGRDTLGWTLQSNSEC